MTGNSVFVIGSFIMGLTIRVPRAAAPGESLMGSEFDMGPGGKGLNLAIAIRRAGGEVGLVMSIGRDIFGQYALDTLKREGLPLDHILQVEDYPTGCGFVTLLPSGENSIVIHAGANNYLQSKQLIELESAIKSSAVVIAQLEVSPDVAETAMILGKKHGCLTILNPAPARPISAHTLAHVDILTPNESEARVLLGLAPDSEVPTETLAQRLLELGPSTIVLTQGRRGALIATAQGIRTIASPTIDLVDSTGAGDAFNGHLAYHLARGKSVEEAVGQAVYAGAFCAGKLGVINGLPTTTELEDFIKKQNV